MDHVILYFVSLLIHTINGAMPGTFFWKPRLGLDLAIPTTEVTLYVNKPTKENIRAGLVVLIDGYQAGMTVVALAAGVSSAKSLPHLDPLAPDFYTSSYRWALRHFSLMPFWLGGNGGAYCGTHRVWKRRFFYMEEFIPKWLRNLLPYIKDAEWEKEIKDFRLYKKYSEPAFAKFYRYPNKIYNDFLSMETEESKTFSGTSISLS